MAKTSKSTAMLVGGFVCALGRSVVLLIHYGAFNSTLVFLTLPSAIIGLCVGAIAGAIENRLISPIVGGILSGLVFEIVARGFALFFCCAGLFFGDQNAVNGLDTDTWTYTGGMAIAGVIGGLASGRIHAQIRKENAESVTENVTPQDDEHEPSTEWTDPMA